MPDPLDALRAKARRDVTLDSGDTVTVRRISMMDAVILAEDDVPAPVLTSLMAEGKEPDAPQPADEMLAEIRKVRRRQKRIVREAVVAVNGKPATIAEDVDLAELFTDDDMRAISDTALWADTEGKA